MTLLICRTCPRYDTRTTGTFGRRLTAAITEITRTDPTTAVPIRNVQCLGGCPDDGVIALDAPHKARVRFTHLDETHAQAVLTAAAAHHACTTGAPDDWTIPTELTNRLSSVTFKQPPEP